VTILTALLITLGLHGFAGADAPLPTHAAPAAPADSGEAELTPEVDPGLVSLVRAVESAWWGGEAEPLAPYLGRRGVGLSLAGGEIADAWFSRNQARFLLDRLLRSSDTVRFEFIRYRNLAGGPGRPNATAVWEHRPAPDALSRQLVFLSLAQDGGRWVIAEVKTKDRGALLPERAGDTGR
jgi:hypothetical protein